jgi:hypothetical protein
VSGEPNTYDDEDVDEICADKDKRIAELERERLAVTNDEIRALLAEWLRQRSYSADLYQRTRAAMRALARGAN